MANTYSQLYLHYVFATKPSPLSYIKEDQREELEKYITGVITHNQCKLYAIYCNPDHTHLLVSIGPTTSIASLIQKIKSNSSRFIHTRFQNRHFAWQDGYGVFTCSPNAKGSVCNYILTQREHHRRRSFKDEYIFMLEQAEIDYSPDFIFL
ncbi:IS200/IS605 family transposase [Bacteroidales bacterium OttesenSCG-928-L03]|nr:IS200/IS605 family transposase [Bacteroidales bacterium OttesenSCG-928-L03]